jgi:hypothetical protein
MEGNRIGVVFHFNVSKIVGWKINQARPERDALVGILNLVKIITGFPLKSRVFIPE